MTRAAEVLHVAQPALSLAISKLEEELGVILLARGQNRRITPTAEGEILLRRAERIFEEVTSVLKELSDARALRAGVVNIGMPPMYGQIFFGSLVANFQAAYPGVAVRAIEGSAGEIGGMLDEGKVDLAILEARRVRATWQRRLIGGDELVLCVNRHHALAQRSCITGADLDGLDVALLDESFLQRNILDSLCQRAGARYRAVIESNYVPLVLDAAMCGRGAATLMRSLVKEDLGLVGLAFDPPEMFHFNLCWLDTRHLSKANLAFLNYVLDSGKPISEEGL